MGVYVWKKVKKKPKRLENSQFLKIILTRNNMKYKIKIRIERSNFTGDDSLTACFENKSLILKY